MEDVKDAFKAKPHSRKLASIPYLTGKYWLTLH